MDKCHSHYLKKKFLEKDDLTLEDVLKISKAHEVVTSQLKDMGSASVSNDGTDDVNAISKNLSVPNHSIECFACGKHGHRKGSWQCKVK